MTSPLLLMVGDVRPLPLLLDLLGPPDLYSAVYELAKTRLPVAYRAKPLNPQDPAAIAEALAAHPRGCEVLVVGAVVSGVVKVRHAFLREVLEDGRRNGPYVILAKALQDAGARAIDFEALEARGHMVPARHRLSAGVLHGPALTSGELAMAQKVRTDVAALAWAPSVTVFHRDGRSPSHFAGDPFDVLSALPQAAHQGAYIYLFSARATYGLVGGPLLTWDVVQLAERLGVRAIFIETAETALLLDPHERGPPGVRDASDGRGGDIVAGPPVLLGGRLVVGDRNDPVCTVHVL